MDNCTDTIEVFREYIADEPFDPDRIARLYDSLVASPRIARMARELAAAQALLEAAGLADATFADDLEAE